MISVTVITADSRPEQETQQCLVLPAPTPLGAEQPSAVANHRYLSMALEKAAGEPMLEHSLKSNLEERWLCHAVSTEIHHHPVLCAVANQVTLVRHERVHWDQVHRVSPQSVT